MGMYTEFHFNAKLKRDTPPIVLDVLRYMVGDREEEPLALPTHELFTLGWTTVLNCDSSYFDADTHSTLRYDDIAGTHFLCVRANSKNYDGAIEVFVEWITPYLDKYPGDFLGFSRYEETEQPDLIHMPGGPDGEQ